MSNIECDEINPVDYVCISVDDLHSVIMTSPNDTIAVGSIAALVLDHINRFCVRCIRVEALSVDRPNKASSETHVRFKLFGHRP